MYLNYISLYNQTKLTIHVITKLELEELEYRIYVIETSILHIPQSL